MAEKKKMTVAEILAAARKTDGGQSGDSAAESAQEPAAPAAESAPAEETSASESQAKEETAKPAPPAPKPGGRPSVADILARARATDKPGAEKPAAAPKPKAEPKAAEPKPTAKPAAKPAAKADAKAAAAAKPAARLDTASILASARAKEKPGPITKAEAAQKEPVKAKAAPVPKLTVPPMPEKPAYAMASGSAVAVKALPAKPASGATRPVATLPERRPFLFFSILFGTALAAAFTMLSTAFGLWGLALARFMFPNVRTEPPSKFRVGFPDEFPPDKVSDKFKSQFGVWVVNYSYKGIAEIYALSTVCTHLGCTPNWLEAEQKFKCPCHGSGFYKDGINFEGPAPRPLERYAIRIAEDGQLEIDKSRKFQEEMGQWEDRSSYVPV